MATYKTSRRTLLTLFLTVNDLLREEAYRETLEEIWEAPDEFDLVGFLASELTDELSQDEAITAVQEFLLFLPEAVGYYLAALAKELEIEVNTRLFMRISRAFLAFEEPWEEVLVKDDFVAYAEFHEGRLEPNAIPFHRLLLTGFVLARSAEELEHLQGFPTFAAVAAALADEN